MNRRICGLCEVINIIFKIRLLTLADFTGRSIKMKDK